MTVETESFKIFAEALAVGLLIGMERYKDRDPGEKKSAGMRTFAIISLLGAVAGLLQRIEFSLAIFAALVALMALGYSRKAPDGIGLTTEMTALLTFWLGYLMRGHEALVVSVGIVTVVILASKRALHDFVRGQVSDMEFYDTLKFLAVVFVVFPLLPDRGLGPHGFFNPTELWKQVILVSTISYSGYVLVRVLGERRGLLLGAVVGGIVSTTAVTVSLAERARKAPGYARLCGMAALLAHSVQFPRILALIWVVDPVLGLFVAPMLAGMLLIGMLGAWLLTRVRRAPGDDAAAPVVVRNPYSFWPALKFALFFLGVTLISDLANHWLGERGLYLASAVSGLVGMSPIALAVANLVHASSLALPVAAKAILISLAVNSALKLILSLSSGTRSFALWQGLGMLVSLLVGLGVLSLSQDWLLAALP